MTQKIITFLLFILTPAFLLAHGSHGHGVMAGFTHPILGIDHNIALVGTGLLGYVLDYKKWFLLPLVFISAMAIGGFLGIGNEATFTIEKLIAFSVLAIGITLVLRQRLNPIFILLFLAFFGFIHGYAHGAEMSSSNTPYKYIPGFTMGAGLLASLGAFVAKLIYSTSDQSIAISLASGIVIGCGIMMLLP